ncbi:MAG: glycosyltransferase [Oscillospiraceae bacterium]|nr:glycosyltransferase [Oscillospiraceae bacterium]
MKFSIILPVYNVEKYLPKIFYSLKNQSFTDFEALFIVDGSPDNSYNVLLDLVGNDERFKVYLKENTGVGETRNYGMDRATGNYICFLDPDDWVEFDLLEEVAKKTINNPELIIWGCFFEYTSGKRKKTIYLNREHNLLSNNEFAHFIEKRYFHIIPNVVWNKAYSKSFLVANNIRFCNQKSGQDALFNYHVYPVVNKISIINRPLTYYLMFREGSTSSSYNKERLKNIEIILQKFYVMLEKWNLKSKKIRISATVDFMYAYSYILIYSSSSYKTFLLERKKTCMFSTLSLYDFFIAFISLSMNFKVKLILSIIPPLMYTLKFLRLR